jgi:outer membrane protein TolC
MSTHVFGAVLCAIVATSAGTPAAQQGPPAVMPLPRLERTTPTGPPLALGDAIDEALQKNPALIALRQEFESVRQRPAQSLFLSPPTFSAQIWQWPINTLNPLNTNMYMLMVEQAVPGRGKRDLRAAVAQKDADLAANQIAMGARQTIADLEHAYTTLMVARKAADVYADAASLLRQLTDAAEAKYASGRISQQDILKPTTELSRLYDQVLTARQQADLAAAQLNVLMGRPADAPIGVLAEPVTTTTLPTANELTQLAIDHQPELQAARLNIERAQADLAAAKSETKPDFMVQGGYMLMPHGTDAWTGQIGVTWPNAPWSRGKAQARIAETAAEISAAWARLRATEAQIRLTVQQAYIKATTAAQRAQLLQTTLVPQSQQTFDVSRIGYETDRVDFLTLLENQRTLLDEQLDYVRALADLTDARTDLERAVGVDLTPASRATLAAPEVVR